jgi:ADP-ribose pyrophosphatase YjhB (NUDIX family)
MIQDDDDKRPVTADHHVQHQYPQNIRFCGLCGGAMRMREVLPDRKRFKVCRNCGYVDFPGPKLVAGCLVIDGGRVLLLRRGIEPQLGQWTFPGGYVDLGETPAQAATRETFEEVGMRVILGELAGLFSDPLNPAIAVAVYMAQPGFEPPGLSAEALEVSYFAPHEIPWAELAFHTTEAALRSWLARLEPAPS